MIPRTLPVYTAPARRFFALSIVMLVAGPVALVGAADHLEAPGVMGRGDVDLNDIYLFQSPTNPDNSVLTLTVNPFAGQISGTDFNDAATYQFLIDNDGDAVADITYSTTFSAPVAGVQSLTTTREAGGTTTSYAMGQTGQNITTADTGTLRADLFDDPFFFDLNGFVNGFNFPGDDAFAGANVSAIVLELPSAELGGPAIGLWAATVDALGQVDRMGRPAINTALIPVGQKDAFNQGEPVDDAAVFSNEVMASLLALSGDAALANALTGVLLPDILTFDTSSSAGFLNGRQLSDDVIDAVLDLVSGGAVTTDLVDANDVAFPGLFPYLAAPNNIASAPAPSTLPLVVLGMAGMLALHRRRRGPVAHYHR